MTDRADVLIVGAGPAGISTAWLLEEAGISFRIVDRAGVPASTWANLYPSLRLNTAGFVSHLPGRRIPLRFGVYPTGRQYYAYVLDALRARPLPIEYGVCVERVTPIPDGWRVVTSCDVGTYRAVVIASGRFSRPVIPPIAGLDEFGGRWLHAHDYTGVEPFAGKRVLVVGNGPSGADIAAELAHAAALPVLLAIRSDIVIAREYPYGLPVTAWHILAGLLPARWRKPFLNRVSFQGYPGQEALGLPLAPNRDDRVGTSAPVRGRALIDGLRAGRIRAVAGLAALTRDSAVLLDGAQHTVDAVIFCTGYRPAVEYLDIAYEEDEAGWMVRRSPDSQQVKDHPGLYLVGRYYRGLGPLHNIRQEARTAVREIAQYLRETNT
jgi:cation diffusion facilitator CzcD-associated flavoprotein CzcO